MKSMSAASWIRRWQTSINWRLLLFLVLFLDVKLVVKLAAVIILLVVRPGFKVPALALKKIPLFYFLAMLLVLVNWLLLKGFTDLKYSFVAFLAILFWALAAFGTLTMKSFTETISSDTIINTLKVFFIINAGITLLQYGSIVIETGAINPFKYQGQFQKYFISTGDYLKGISFDTSTTNAILNAAGVILFLKRQEFRMMFLCLTVMIFAASNLTNFVLLGALLFLFIFDSNRNQKSVIIAALCCFVIFIAKVSPQNNYYIVDSFTTFVEKKNAPIRGAAEKHITVLDLPDSSLNADQKKEKVAILILDSLAKAKSPQTEKKNPVAASLNEKPELPKDNIHTPPFQHRDDTDAVRRELIALSAHQAKMPYRLDQPGKVLSWKESFRFLGQHPFRIITGAGAGNFSSKLAFRATGLHFAGGYPSTLAYVNPAFDSNHLRLYSNLFSRNAGIHSMINSPNSVYDQLVTEYGLAGLAAFAFFYFGFFAKRLKWRSYGMPLLMMLLALFFTDYWFEQLSIVSFFELLFFLDLKTPGA